MRNVLFAAITAIGVAVVAQSFTPVAATTATKAPSTAEALYPGAVKLADGFYEITPPKGIDEAYVVTPVRQTAANGTTMVQVASDDVSEEEVVVYGRRSSGVVGTVSAVLGL